MNKLNFKKPEDVVVSGAGLLNSLGFGPTEVWKNSDAGRLKSRAERSLAEFPVAKHLSDRKLMKVISLADAYGLATVEQCFRAAGLTKGALDPWRIGMYVGAQPSRVSDNDNYNDAIRETLDESGQFNELKFGRTMQGARPTTLLQGLPNNVLCYGSILCDVRGPNSNYTSGEISGLMTLINGAARIRRGQIDVAVVGGYQAQLDPVTASIYQQNGWMNKSNDEIRPFQQSGTVFGDAAAFLLVERRGHGQARGATVSVKYLGGRLFSDGLGFAHLAGNEGAAGRVAVRAQGTAQAILSVCQESGIDTSEIGAVFPSASGIACIDQAELDALIAIYQTAPELPAIISSTRVWGNSMEAGGIGEVAVAPMLMQSGEVPECFRVLPSTSNSVGFPGRWKAERNIFGVLRGTPTGEGAFVLMQVEAL